MNVRAGRQAPPAEKGHPARSCMALFISLMFVIAPLLGMTFLFTSPCEAFAPSDHKFTRYPGNPVLANGTGTSWDNTTMNTSTFMYESGEFLLYYTGGNGALTQIGLARSPDAKNWTKEAANPIFTTGSSGEWDGTNVSDACVINDNSTYKMWYSGYNGTVWSIGYATSTDGLNWSRYSGNPVLGNGTWGDWDGRFVRYPWVLKEDGIYKMWYTGYNGSGNYPYRTIGYANSTDGINWTPSPNNPVIKRGPDDWDDDGVMSPCVLNMSGTFKMWYTGVGFLETTYTGYANATTEDNWTKYKNNPCITGGTDDYLFETGGISNPRVYYNGSIYLMMFNGNWKPNKIGYAEGYNNPIKILSVTSPASPTRTNNTNPEFRYTTTDPDRGDSIQALRIQFSYSRDFETIDYDTGKVVQASGIYTLVDPLPDGQLYWRTRLWDFDDPCAWYGPGSYKLDSTPPRNPTLFASTTHTVDEWSTGRYISVKWFGAVDDNINLHLGLVGYSYSWDYCATTVPDTTKEVGNTATSATSGAMSDSASIYFHIRAIDEYGNAAVDNIHFGPFKIDATAPTNPAVQSDTHDTGNWTSQNIVHVNWSGAADATSGVAGYSYSWDMLSSGLPDQNMECDAATTAATSPGLGNGKWYFHIRTRDWAGNWASTAATLGPFNIDVTPPENPLNLTSSSHVPCLWSHEQTIWMRWDGPDGAESGMAGYSYQWDNCSDSLPDNVSDAQGTASTAGSGMLPDGTNWFFHIRSLDNAGNWNRSALHFGPFWIDSVPPENPVGLASQSHAIGQWSTDITIGVRWAFNFTADSGSGYGGVSIYWDAYGYTVPDPIMDYDQDSTAATSPALPEGKEYYCHVRACDRAGNWAAGASHLGPFGIDNSPPLNPKSIQSYSHVMNKWSAKNQVEVHWGNPSAESSGPSGFGFLWDTRPETVPPAVVNATSDQHFTVSPDLADGNFWYFHLRTVDAAGNWAVDATHAGPFLIDTSAPLIESLEINGGSGSTNRPDVAVRVASTDSPSRLAPSLMRHRVDGTGWSEWRSFSETFEVNLTGPDGERTVQVQVMDRVNHLSLPASQVISLDTVPPTVRIGFDNGAFAVRSSRVPVHATVEDPEPSSGFNSILISLDGQNWTGWYGKTMGTVNLGGPDGVKKVFAKAVDGAGNIGQNSSCEVLLDTRPPAKPTMTLGDGTKESRSTTVPVKVCVTDPDPGSGVDSMRFSEDGGNWTQWRPYAESTTYTFGPEQGQKRLFLAVRDLAGNVAEVVNTTIEFDNALPLLVLSGVAGMGMDRAVVSWFTDVPTNGTVEYGLAGGKARAIRVDGMATEHDCVIGGLDPSTDCFARVSAFDADGKGPAVGPDLFFTTLATPDLRPPVISDIRVEDFHELSVVVCWETDEPADSRVEFANIYKMNASAPGVTMHHRVTVSALAPGISYTLVAMSTDISRNGPSSSEPLVVTTHSSFDDLAAPVMTGVEISGITESAAVVTWTTDELASGRVIFHSNESGTREIAHPAYATAHSFVLGGLLPNTSYYLEVESRDPFPLNSAARVTNLTFTTTGSADLEAPHFTVARVIEAGLHHVIFDITLDEPSTAVVEYASADDFIGALESPGFFRVHGFNISGLEADRSYELRLRVRTGDVSGNRDTFETVLEFRTAENPNAGAPPVIGPTPVANNTRPDAPPDLLAVLKGRAASMLVYLAIALPMIITAIASGLAIRHFRKRYCHGFPAGDDALQANMQPGSTKRSMAAQDEAPASPADPVPPGTDGPPVQPDDGRRQPGVPWHGRGLHRP